MAQINPEISTSTAAPFVQQKLTYEEFLREYDGQYAEYVDFKVIKPMSVTQKHDDLTGFLRAALRFYVETKGLGRICGEAYQMKMTLDGKIKGREPDNFFCQNGKL